jgi:HD-like signal output (HDOD) protein/prolyl-tRNA editing enzyme YbaK/EbsC (Cys-tRNA(Pro) deacylase)
MDDKVLNLVPAEIQRYLQEKGVQYTLLSHIPCNNLLEKARILGIPEGQLIRVVILGDAAGQLMAILPASHLMDFNTLCRDLNRELEPIALKKLKTIFSHCAEGAYPPLAELYHLESIIDNSLNEQETLYFEPGSNEVLIKIEKSEFAKIHEHAWHGDFAEPQSNLLESGLTPVSFAEVIHKFTPVRMQERINETVELPAIPQIADAILRLRVDPKADAKSLSRVVEKDPSLATQLISWAQSPYYGFPGKVTSVEDAIIKVLGFDLVMNLALGIAVGRSMTIPLEGPLGLRAYWRHSVYCATLVESLVTQMPPMRRPIRGLAYLAGLLHNFGHLLLGQIFPPQYSLLNKCIILNPHIRITQIEQYVLGVGHEQIGEWLMQAWRMPEEVVTAVRCHHREEYNLVHAVYSNLVFVAVRLLWTMGIGDAGTSDISKEVLESLGLKQSNLDASMEIVKAKQVELDSMAKEVSK